MEDTLRTSLIPGAKVTITQQIPHRNRTWTSKITGTITQYFQKTTGSWYAHSKDDKLWLDRLQIRKEDGELTTLNLDEFTVIELIK